MSGSLLSDGPVSDSPSTLLGPFRFEIGFDGFKQMFHAENDRYMRKLGAGGVLCTGWIIPGEIYYIVKDLYQGTFVFSWTDLWGFLCGVAISLGFLWLLIRPPFSFLFRLDEVARFFAARGADFPGEDVDPRGVVVSVSTSLCELGGEEVTADGTVIRTPFMVMRKRPVWTRDFLFLAVRDRGRDSVLWNVVAEGGGLFRRAWNGDGVALPRTCVQSRCAVSREVRARVREASRRYKRAVRLAKHAGHNEARRDKALALVAPELAWLEEADRLNEENRRLRKTGAAPPVAQRLVPIEGPGRAVRTLRMLWRCVKVVVGWLRVLAAKYDKPLPDILRDIKEARTQERVEVKSGPQDAGNSGRNIRQEPQSPVNDEETDLKRRE